MAKKPAAQKPKRPASKKQVSIRDEFRIFGSMAQHLLDQWVKLRGSVESSEQTLKGDGTESRPGLVLQVDRIKGETKELRADVEEINTSVRRNFIALWITAGLGLLAAILEALLRGNQEPRP